jgi:hypothetical protein
LFISYITIIFSLFSLSPFPQPNPVVFSGRTKVRKNNEESLILHVFNSSECLILHVSGYSERLHQFIEDHIKQVAISLLRKISMTWCIGVWITLDSKLHLQKAPLSALFAYFPASAFSSYLFPAQKSFFEKKYQSIII